MEAAIAITVTPTINSNSLLEETVGVQAIFRHTLPVIPATREMDAALIILRKSSLVAMAPWSFLLTLLGHLPEARR